MKLSEKLDNISNHRNDIERVQMNEELYNELQFVVARKFVDELCGPIELMETIEYTLNRIFLGYAVKEPERYYNELEIECIHEIHSNYLKRIRTQIEITER